MSVNHESWVTDLIEEVNVTKRSQDGATSMDDSPE